MTIDERISSELRSHLPDVDEGIAWERIRAAATAPKHRVRRLVPIAVGAVGVALVAVVLYSTLTPGSTPVADNATPFLGGWTHVDTNGSTVSLAILVTDDGAIEMTEHDGAATVCSGAPSTMTGTGEMANGALVIASPAYTCDDGTEPQSLGATPLDEQLRNLTFTHDVATDTLTDSLGATWSRPGTIDPTPEPTAGGMWPQATLEEVRAAQTLADDGDPTVTWQLEPALEDDLLTGGYEDAAPPEIFARFVREQLGWEDAVQLSGVAFGTLDTGVQTIILTYVRCAPGQTDPFYPNEPRTGGCVPTPDDTHYETYEITVAQPGVQGPSGIWVVMSSTMVEPMERVAPLTDDDAATIISAFLRARLTGNGAEQYLGGPDGRARLLYATTTGSAYETYEFQITEQAQWPNGWIGFDAQMFADGGATVVEQSFALEHGANGAWTVEPDGGISENGTDLPPINDLVGGQVIFTVGDPWTPSMFGNRFDTDGKTADAWFGYPDGGYIAFLADPLLLDAECHDLSAPVDATELAQSILSNPAFAATAPVAATIGGVPALQVDVTSVADECDGWGRWAVSVGGHDPGDHVRLYLIDLPGGPARILSIAVVAPEAGFETVVEAAVPILDSIQFFG